MSFEDREKLQKLDEMKARVYSKNSPDIVEHRDDFSAGPEYKIPDSWAKETDGLNFFEKIFMHTPAFKKFFIFSILFFFLALGYAAYNIYFKGTTVSSKNIDIAVIGDSFTEGGKELSLVVEITNKNNIALDSVDLILEYPKDSFDGAPQENERLRQTIGTIPSGGVHSETVKLILFGEQGSTRNIKISMEYRVDGSNATFTKNRDYEVSINSTPLDLSVTGPTNTSPNQEMSFQVKAVLNSDEPASSVLLRVDYPAGFKFTSSVPEPAYGDNVWSLGDLSPGAEKMVTVKGRMLDVFDGEEKVFRIQSGSQSNADKYAIGVIFNSIAYQLDIKRPLLEARLYINGVYQSEHSVQAKSKVTAEIRWSNNLETKINDFSVRARLTGNALDRRSIFSDFGFYNSLEDSIIWDKNSVKQFKEVNPGDSGVLAFSFDPISLFSGSGGLLQDPAVYIEVSATGKQPSDSYALANLNNQETIKIKISSDVGFAAKGMYYSGAFTNTGPVPPKAEQKTTYTIVWTLTNTANTISKAKVTSTLPQWADFVGTTPGAKEELTYNPSTKEIVWNVGTIPRGSGISGIAKEVSFQISITPSLSQIGSSPVIINDSVLTGFDDFANVDVRVNKSSLNTKLVNDPQFPSFGDRVVE